VLLNAKSLEAIKTLQEEGHVDRAKFSRDGSRLACSTPGDQSVVSVWDMRTQQIIAQWTHTAYVTDLAFSPDGRTLAVASKDLSKSIVLWDCQTGREIRSLTGHANGEIAVAFLSDGTRLVSSSNDGSTRVWNALSGRQIARLEGYGLRYLALSRDGKRLATASEFHGKSQILIWDVDRILRELARHELAAR
jgi:WD40 repeat protein